MKDRKTRILLALRNITVANGATPAEESVAKSKIRQIAATYANTPKSGRMDSRFVENSKPSSNYSRERDEFENAFKHFYKTTSFHPNL